MSNNGEIKFDSEEVKKDMNSLEDTFTQFADTLEELNSYIETMVNAGEDSAILGEYGAKLFKIWSANASSFGDFHANFEAWNEVVAIISANNEEFVVKTTDLYRDNGSTLNGVQDARNFVAEYGRTGDTSNLSESVQKVLAGTSKTLAGASVPPVSNKLNSDALLKVGDTIHAEVDSGLEGDFTYQGLSQRGDMTQEQIFSDKNGNLYYYEDGVMKPVNIRTSQYDELGGEYDVSYNKQATVDNLGKSDLYFQDSNGNYNGAGANKSYKAGLDTDGSSSPNDGYSMSVADYKTWDRNNYEGKGTTFLVPDENYNKNDYSAKDMIITSVIDVRNNISQEAVEMQTYLDMNRSSLTSDQITELNKQITLRTELATQMGTDVQHGLSVDDGVIGDWGTWSIPNGDQSKAYDNAMEAIEGYVDTMDEFKSIDQIVGK